MRDIIGRSILFLFGSQSCSRPKELAHSSHLQATIHPTSRSFEHEPTTHNISSLVSSPEFQISCLHQSSYWSGTWTLRGAAGVSHYVLRTICGAELFILSNALKSIDARQRCHIIIRAISIEALPNAVPVVQAPAEFATGKDSSKIIVQCLFQVTGLTFSLCHTWPLL